MSRHDDSDYAARIVRLFDRTFVATHNTRLEGGGVEPVYLPAQDNQVHRIVFRADYAASALHECAHWCLAGAARRQLEDYGYWYVGNRGNADQRQFERAEARPQALEWIFGYAAGHRFRVSVDNFSVTPGALTAFRQAVRLQLQQLLLAGLPPRAQAFAEVLAEGMPRGRADFAALTGYPELPDG